MKISAPWSLWGVLLATVAVGCSGTRSSRCDSCNPAAVYPPPGCYSDAGTFLTEPPHPTAPMPIPVPSTTDPVLPPGTDSTLPAPPPPPLGVRVPAALQNIRYSTSEFFHNANENVRAMFAR